VDYFLRLKGIDGEATTLADDVFIDGRVITAESYESATRFGQSDDL
jgi:hypothetical protein